MKKNWMNNLSSDVYARLCNCRTVKADLAELVNAKWLHYREAGKDKQGFTKEDAVVAVLELLDCNSCDFELTADEYAELCR